MVSYTTSANPSKSQIGSRASQRSKVSKNSFVDESLFGGNKGTAKGQGATILSMEELRAIRNKTEKNNQTDAVIITKADLERIKGATTIKTKEHLLQEKRLQEE